MFSILIVGVVVAIGAVAGRLVGGTPGLLVNSFLATTVAVAITEIARGRVCATFWLRNRGALLAAVSMLAGGLLGESMGGWLGLLIGLVSGWLGGFGLVHEWGWLRERIEMLLYGWLHVGKVLFAAAQIDGPMSEQSRQFVNTICHRLFSSVGTKNHRKLEELVLFCAAEPASPESASEFLGGLPVDMQFDLTLHVLRLLFEKGALSECKKAWLMTFLSAAGERACGLLFFYDRSHNKNAAQRSDWLQTLGVCENATAEEIREAYRKKAQEYHPDQHTALPEQIRRLTEEKMASITVAYRQLTRNDENGDDWEVFRSDDGCSTVRRDGQDEITCVCWVCDQKNRLESRAPSQTARCGACHALLGLPADMAEGLASDFVSAGRAATS